MLLKLKDKFFVISAISLLLFALITVRLIKLQIVDANEYKAKSEAHLSSYETITAPRGKILDRYGRTIVSNRLGFSVYFNNSSMSDDQLNDLIVNTVELFRENDDEYVDTFPIAVDGKNYIFKYKDLEGDELETKIRNFKFSIGISDNLDAKQCMNTLAKKFNIDKRYTLEEMRDIASARYEMAVRGFSSASPFNFSSDVSIETVSAIEENNKLYSGLNVTSAPVRNYMHGTLAAHILGRVGLISGDEYEQHKSEGYGMNSIIGKDGLEKILESHIKGVDGSKSVSRRVGEDAQIEEIAAIPGNNAMLTIDIDLQRVAEKALADTVESIKQSSWHNADNAGADVGGGAVVVEDVNTGEILAIANYPTYDPARFSKDYSILSTDASKPLFNRAISGAYPPGSVFKMLTTIAALEEKIVSPSTIIEDMGVYEYYDQKFNCWVYTESGETHGPMDAANALKNSCNYYYYETGKRLGIDTLEQYGKKMRLGEKTGIELDGETTGVLATKEYKEKTFNEIWYPGDTLQMAIGQSYNLFSPIQLANYTSTIANRGTIYKTHILKCIRDHATGSIISETNSEKMDTVEMSESTYEAVTRGMRLVSYEGTASSVFGDYPIETCSKTGSSQINGGSANGVFVSYAPYHKPQIAISIVIENAGSGSSTAPIAKAIYDEYFKLNSKQAGDVITKKNSLIR